MPDATTPPSEAAKTVPEPQSLGEPRALPAAAVRALREAEERRKAAAAPAAPEEIGGRGGQEPARYGDWEVKGIASDF
jgi:hypothetical protein